jgi:subtilisin family serine protease
MKPKFTLAIIFVFISALAHGQYNKLVIELTDKKGTAHTIANPATYLSAKAIGRRTKQKLVIDSTDLPVSKDYLDSLRSIPNVAILNTSKWLNQVLIEADDAAALDRINNFPFVKSIKEVGPKAKPSAGGPALKKFGTTTATLPNSRTQQVHDITSLNYGNTFNQIHIHEGEYLHNLGFTGQGITIAILDGGFNSYKTNPAFDSLRLQGRILGEWDFVEGNASVNEDHEHGANCLSIIAANRPGVIVGSAPHASFWLLRTENTTGEYPVEEQNWAAAAEFADSIGADMISSSLGYADFDDPQFDHSYADRDGNTAISTRAADLAAKKGMIVVNSAGNSGQLNNELKFVGCPADGDSVFTVGGVDVNGNIYPASSWGPNSNGLVKPNVVSVGQGTIYAAPTGNAASGSGTSYACPNMAGLIACLWQAFPEFTNMEIIDYVQRASNRFDDPDERSGYGIPNFALAYNLLANEREVRNSGNVLGNKWLKAYPVPFPDNLTVMFKAQQNGKANLLLIDMMGRLVETKTLNTVTDQVYIVRFTKAAGLPKGVYYVRYLDGKNRETLPVIRR